MSIGESSFLPKPDSNLPNQNLSNDIRSPTAPPPIKASLPDNSNGSVYEQARICHTAKENLEKQVGETTISLTASNQDKTPPEVKPKKLDGEEMQQASEVAGEIAGEVLGNKPRYGEEDHSEIQPSEPGANEEGQVVEKPKEEEAEQPGGPDSVDDVDAAEEAKLEAEITAMKKAKEEADAGAKKADTSEKIADASEKKSDQKVDTGEQNVTTGSQQVDTGEQREVTGDLVAAQKTAEMTTGKKIEDLNIQDFNQLQAAALSPISEADVKKNQMMGFKKSEDGSYRQCSKGSTPDFFYDFKTGGIHLVKGSDLYNQLNDPTISAEKKKALLQGIVIRDEDGNVFKISRFNGVISAAHAIGVNNLCHSVAEARKEALQKKEEDEQLRKAEEFRKHSFSVANTEENKSEELQKAALRFWLTLQSKYPSVIRSILKNLEKAATERASDLRDRKVKLQKTQQQEKEEDTSRLNAEKMESEEKVSEQLKADTTKSENANNSVTTNQTESTAINGNARKVSKSTVNLKTGRATEIIHNLTNSILMKSGA